MRVALCSDLHLGGPEDPNHPRFLHFLGSLEADHLVLLGDVFQHWWHFGADPFPAYAPIVEALRRRAFPLTVLPGNHDFHAPAFFAEQLGAIVPGGDGFVHASWDGLHAHLHHGDLVDESLGYRAISAVLRGRAFAAAVDGMGPKRAWRFLARLTGHGRVTPNPVLVGRQRLAAAKILAEGAGGEGLVVFGHTHVASSERVPGGTYLNLGDMVEAGTWATVEDGVPVLRRWGGTDSLQGHSA